MNRSINATLNTPKALDYRFPAEWEPHAATWLSWPHNEDTWPGVFDRIFAPYTEFVKAISQGEKVCVCVEGRKKAEEILEKYGADLSRIELFPFPTNDAWCRDHGPAFLISENHPKAVVNWVFNSWGSKYPYELDAKIPSLIANHYRMPIFRPGIVLEGGSIEVNGKGALLTTKACLLNRNRNPNLLPHEIEEYLIDYYAIDQVLWLERGIEGDDTDGHIDDIARFVSEDTVVAPLAYSASHPDYQVLKENFHALEKMKLKTGKEIRAIALPVPSPYIEDGKLLPCSYANFYICNAAVIVPTFQDPQDEVALEVLSRYFPDRKVVGIPSKDIILGLGSFHCLSQQEPIG